MRPTHLFKLPQPIVTPPASLVPYASIHPDSPHLKVRFGQITFDAEGRESRGSLFSRVMHWPGGASGVTIGRGYDMGSRTRLQVISELTYAGMSPNDAAFYGDAAGLRGESAARFVRSHVGGSPILSLPTQRKLFEEVTATETLADVRRILAKPDLQSKYGIVTWEGLSSYAQEILFDLRYRGDYTPETRTRIQPLLVSGNDAALQAVMNDVPYWSRLGVPAERIRERAALPHREEMARQAG